MEYPQTQATEKSPNVTTQCDVQPTTTPSRAPSAGSLTGSRPEAENGRRSTPGSTAEAEPRTDVIEVNPTNDIVTDPASPAPAHILQHVRAAMAMQLLIHTFFRAVEPLLAPPTIMEMAEADEIFCYSGFTRCRTNNVASVTKLDQDRSARLAATMQEKIRHSLDEVTLDNTDVEPSLQAGDPTTTPWKHDIDMECLSPTSAAPKLSPIVPNDYPTEADRAVELSTAATIDPWLTEYEPGTFFASTAPVEDPIMFETDLRCLLQRSLPYLGSY